eukprot:3523861-Pyramimonas_sp.AAC.1
MQRTNAPGQSASVSVRISSAAPLAQADAPAVYKSVPVITSPLATLQPELSAENRQHLSRS